MKKYQLYQVHASLEILYPHHIVINVFRVEKDMGEIIIGIVHYFQNILTIRNVAVKIYMMIIVLKMTRTKRVFATHSSYVFSEHVLFLIHMTVLIVF